MKMAERQNIVAMGLDPAQVISFGGGWVNHAAPDEFRQAYQSIVSDPGLFHTSGGYTATLGDLECREQIARFVAGQLVGPVRLQSRPGLRGRQAGARRVAARSGGLSRHEVALLSPPADRAATGTAPDGLRCTT